MNNYYNKMVSIHYKNIANLLITVHEGNAKAFALSLMWNFLFGLNLITCDVKFLSFFLM